MERKCNLILDSCCDLPYELINREGVDLIKFPYFFGTEEYADDMYQSMTPKEFYDRMRKGEQPTTAQASIPVLREAFEKAAASGMPTVYLCFTSGMSSSYDQACMVCEQVSAEHPEADLRVVDTHEASTGEALVVYEALRQQELGLTADEMEAWALEARNFANVYFMVEDLETLKRGGRIPSSVAVMGSKLDVKPILMIVNDGTLSIKGVARGRKKGMRQLVDIFKERIEPGSSPEYVCVGNADAEHDMKRLEDMIVKEGFSPMFIEGSIGPVIGSHVGPGMISLVFWGKDTRDNSSIVDRISRKVRNDSDK